MGEAGAKGRNTARERPPFWVVSTYFAEGFPYSLVRQVSTVFFTDAGASLGAIGLTSLYGLPWVVKFLWAPLVDAFATKRRWVLAAEGALGTAVLCMALFGVSARAMLVPAVLFLVIAFFSATHDIGVDGFYLEALDRKRQARYVGYQAMAYRLALIAGGGGLVWLSGRTSWRTGFLSAAGLLFGLFLFHYVYLPKIERQARSLRDLIFFVFRVRTLLWIGAAAAAVGAGYWMHLEGLWEKAAGPALPFIRRVGFGSWMALALLVVLAVLAFNLPRLKRRLYASDTFYARAFVDYLDQKHVAAILAFIVLYRAGESFLLGMVYPMLKEVGVTRQDYGLLYGTFGVTASIVGGILGGHLIGRFGLKRVIWPLVLAQNIPNLLYAFLAWHYRANLHVGGGHFSMALVGACVVVEALGSGLGTAVFMVFIMRTARPEYKAAHMSIATSIMNVASTFSGAFSGFLAGSLGFPLYFAFTFLATFPAMGLIFFLPYLNDADWAAERDRLPNG